MEHLSVICALDESTSSQSTNAEYPTMVAPDGSDLEHGSVLGWKPDKGAFFAIPGGGGTPVHPRIAGRTIRGPAIQSSHLANGGDLAGTSESNFRTSATNLPVWGFIATDRDAVIRPPIRPLRCAETGSLPANRLARTRR